MREPSYIFVLQASSLYTPLRKLVTRNENEGNSFPWGLCCIEDWVWNNRNIIQINCKYVRKYLGKNCNFYMNSTKFNRNLHSIFLWQYTYYIIETGKQYNGNVLQITTLICFENERERYKAFKGLQAFKQFIFIDKS